MFEVLWPLFILSLLALTTYHYLRGWRRLQSELPTLATRRRLIAFLLCMAALTLALVWPLPQISPWLLSARTLQKALIVFCAAPLYWLGCSLHVIGWGLPINARRFVTRYAFRRSWLTSFLAMITGPGLVWLIFLASFLAWHDSRLADTILANRWLRVLAPLWLLVAANLFWGQIVSSGPRRYTTRSDVVRLLMLISVEVPNIATGMYIAYQPDPIYQHYVAQRAAFPAEYLNVFSLPTDQMLAGAINWILGSVVYFGSIVLLVNAMWNRHGGGDHPEPPLNWDADEKFIMPGLEDRVIENRGRRR